MAELGVSSVTLDDSVSSISPSNTVMGRSTAMASSTSSSSSNTVKRKLEKFRSKLVELFFSPNPINGTNAEPTVAIGAGGARRKSSNSSRKGSIILIEQSNNINNFYYGYKSHLDQPNETEDLVEDMKSLRTTTSNGTNNKRRVSSSCSSASNSSIAKTTQHNTGLNTTNGSQQLKQHHKAAVQSNKMTESMYDTSSLNTNNTFDSLPSEMASCCHYYDSNNNNLVFDLEESEASNPFLNDSFTKYISFNTELPVVKAIFEPNMHLIDDQDNFFDINFMTNYIAYILLVKIKSSPTLSQLYGDNFNLKASDDIDNKSSELLCQLARQIYLESETEPCGLKGCKLSIFLEADQPLQQQQQQQEQLVESQPVNYLLTQFMFDSSSSLTTFELNLFLKQKPGVAVSHTGTSSEENVGTSSFATLTKRLLSKSNSNSSKSSTLTKSNYPNTSHQANFHIYIDPTNYNLFKCKLY